MMQSSNKFKPITYKERAVFYHIETMRQGQNAYYSNFVYSLRARSVLIAPCSTGNFVSDVSKVCDKVIALDSEKEMIRSVQHKIFQEKLVNCTTVQADIKDVLIDEPVDVIIVPNEGIHLFSQDGELESVLCQLHKLCRLGGSVLFEMFDFDTTGTDKLRYFSYDETDTLIEDINYTDQNFSLQRWHYTRKYRDHIHVQYFYYYRINNSSPRYLSSEFNLFLLPISEFMADLYKCGFKVKRTYHGYTTERFQLLNHGHLIIEAICI